MRGLRFCNLIAEPSFLRRDLTRARAETSPYYNGRSLSEGVLKSLVRIKHFPFFLNLVF